MFSTINGYYNNLLPSAAPIKTPSAMQKASDGSLGHVEASSSGAGSTSTDAVIAEMESLGVSVTVKAVPKDSEAMRRLANSAGGHGEVYIAPNILENMANDPEIRQKYLGEISDWQNRRASHNAMLSAMGMQSVHSSMVIHEDGSVTYNSMSASSTGDEEDDDDRTASKWADLMLSSSLKSYRLNNPLDSDNAHKG